MLLSATGSLNPVAETAALNGPRVAKPSGPQGMNLLQVRLKKPCSQQRSLVHRLSNSQPMLECLQCPETRMEPSGHHASMTHLRSLGPFARTSHGQSSPLHARWLASAQREVRQRPILQTVWRRWWCVLRWSRPCCPTMTADAAAF